MPEAPVALVGPGKPDEQPHVEAGGRRVDALNDQFVRASHDRVHVLKERSRHVTEARTVLSDKQRPLGGGVVRLQLERER